MCIALLACSHDMPGFPKSGHIYNYFLGLLDSILDKIIMTLYVGENPISLTSDHCRITG